MGRIFVGDLDVSSETDQNGILSEAKEQGEVTMPRMILSLFALPMAISMSTAHAQWKNLVSRDEMTGGITAYAISERVGPTERMSFPYSDVEAWIGVGCSESGEWAFVGFSEAPNIPDDLIRNGYNEIRTRIRWDNTVENVRFRQEWGASFLQFQSYEDAIANLFVAGSVLLELNWYGQGNTYFRFPLTGSTVTIEEMRETCGPAQQEYQAEQRAMQQQREAREAEASAFKELQNEAYTEIVTERVEISCAQEEGYGFRACEARMRNELARSTDGYIRDEPNRSRHMQLVENLSQR